MLLANAIGFQSAAGSPFTPSKEARMLVPISPRAVTSGKKVMMVSRY